MVTTTMMAQIKISSYSSNSYSIYIIYNLLIWYFLFFFFDMMDSMDDYWNEMVKIITSPIMNNTHSKNYLVVLCPGDDQ